MSFTLWVQSPWALLAPHHPLLPRPTSSISRIIKASPGSSVVTSSVERNAAWVALNCTCVNIFSLSVFLLWSNAQLRLCRCLNELNLCFCLRPYVWQKHSSQTQKKQPTESYFCFYIFRLLKRFRLSCWRGRGQQSQLSHSHASHLSLQSPCLCREVLEHQIRPPGNTSLKNPHWNKPIFVLYNTATQMWTVEKAVIRMITQLIILTANWRKTHKPDASHCAQAQVGARHQWYIMSL